MGVVVPEPIVENHRLENFRVENWRASVESEALRKPSAGISPVGRSVGPLCHWRGGQVIVGERPRGISWFMSLLSFTLKKFLSFLSKQKSSLSLSLSPSQFKPTFKIFSKRRKKPAAVAAPFLLILRFPLYAFVFLSHVTSIAKK